MKNWKQRNLYCRFEASSNWLVTGSEQRSCIKVAAGQKDFSFSWCAEITFLTISSQWSECISCLHMQVFMCSIANQSRLKEMFCPWHFPQTICTSTLRPFRLSVFWATARLLSKHETNFRFAFRKLLHPCSTPCCPHRAIERSKILLLQEIQENFFHLSVQCSFLTNPNLQPKTRTFLRFGKQKNWRKSWDNLPFLGGRGRKRRDLAPVPRRSTSEYLADNLRRWVWRSYFTSDNSHSSQIHFPTRWPWLTKHFICNSSRRSHKKGVYWHMHCVHFPCAHRMNKQDPSRVNMKEIQRVHPLCWECKLVFPPKFIHLCK